MGFFSWLFWGRGQDVKELARRLDVEPKELRSFQPRYREFTVPKRNGAPRTIFAPDDDTKKLQRKILRRLLGRLRVHSAATGFEPGCSIVTNARAHQGRAAVIRFDLVDFFPSTAATRVRRYFRIVGWNRQVAKMLTRFVTLDDGLPQGAPTSPRLSNLINYRLDARLAAMAQILDGNYTRYADDITISLHDPQNTEDSECTSIHSLAQYLPSLPSRIRFLHGFVCEVVAEEGYRLHGRKKTSVRRRHHRQQVTGLVVNQKVNLPRETRRWLRAIEHRMHLAKVDPLGAAQRANYMPIKRPTLTQSQMEGWRAYRDMIEKQAGGQ